MAFQYDYVLFTCFGTKKVSLFHDTYLSFYLSCKEKISVPSSLTILSDEIHKSIVPVYPDIMEYRAALHILSTYYSKKRIIIVPLLLQEAGEYDMLRHDAFDSLTTCHVTVLKPLLYWGKSFANVLSQVHPKENENAYLLVGHSGINGYDNEFRELLIELSRIDRDDFYLHLIHGIESIKDSIIKIKSSGKQKITVIPIFLCNGHHMKEIKQCLQNCDPSIMIYDKAIFDEPILVNTIREELLKCINS